MPAKKDFTQIAYAVVQQATGAVPKEAPDPKQEGQRKGGLKGGKSRMENMTPEQRRELALRAAGARWKGKTPAPQETAGGRKR